MPDNTIITVTLHAAIDRVIETPQLAIGAHINARQRTCYPGGKGINVSTALNRLTGSSPLCKPTSSPPQNPPSPRVGSPGIPNTATGFVGRPDLTFFNNRLPNARFVPVDQPTRVNLTLIDPQANTDLHLRFEGYHVTADDVARLADTLDELVSEGSRVAFCGSLPPGVNVEALLKLIERVQQRGAHVAIDLAGEALRQAIAQGCWLAKPNEQELAEVTGVETFASEKQLIAAAEALRKKVTHVIVTRGSEPSLWLGPNGIWRGQCKVPPSKIVNTVGCGDCFLAGLLGGFAWPTPLDPENIFRLALATATANALSPGVADFTTQQIEDLKNHCHVESVLL